MTPRRPLLPALLPLAALSLSGVDDLAPLGDEFDDPSLLSRWQRIFQVEGWGADQLEAIDVGSSRLGALTLMPHTSSWYQDWRGVLLFKPVDGDFVVTTDVEPRRRSGAGAPQSTYSLAGIMVRAPRPSVTSPATWSAGGENYVFLSLGAGDPAGSFMFEVKTTEDSDSQLQLQPAGASRARIQVVRVGSAIICLRQPEGGSWSVHRRYSRTDLPAGLQVGLTVYTDWPNASAFAPFTHNQTVITAAVRPQRNPDLVAHFDYVRFRRPSIPPELAAADFSDPAQVPDGTILALFGASADVPYLTPSASWRQTHWGATEVAGNAGHDQDPDADNRSNALEYALGGLPLTPDAVPGEPAILAPGPGTVATSGAVFTFRRDTTATDVSLRVEVRATPGTDGWTIAATTDGGSTWTPELAGASASETPDGIVTVTLPAGAFPGGTAVARLVAEFR